MDINRIALTQTEITDLLKYYEDLERSDYFTKAPEVTRHFIKQTLKLIRATEAGYLSK
tara:strand:- start:1913 stop:2086 length:174 start_codon:yes stop_codon:yes gene_type:complete